MSSVQVFYRENLERELERIRETELRSVCKIIYRIVLTVICRCVCVCVCVCMHVHRRTTDHSVLILTIVY